MTPVNCRIRHDPECGQYGDCIRACIATILDVDAEDVPHFSHDDPAPETILMRVREWLCEWSRGTIGLLHLIFPGDVGLSDMLEYMGSINPDSTYMLFGNTGPGGGDHVVVCQADRIVHDPAWHRMPIRQPGRTLDGQPLWQLWFMVGR